MKVIDYGIMDKNILSPSEQNEIMGGSQAVECEWCGVQACGANVCGIEFCPVNVCGANACVVNALPVPCPAFASL